MDKKLITLIIPTINPAYMFYNNQIDKNFDIIIEVDYKHVGAGETRNKALEQVKTPYVVFMDDDDQLPPTAIMLYNEIIKDEQPEVILGKITRSYTNNTMDDDLGQLYSEWTWLHGKCYSMKFLNKHNIRFPKGVRYNEDVSFNNFVRNYANDDKLIRVETTTYYFIGNENSTCYKMYQDNNKRCKEKTDALRTIKLILPYILKENSFLYKEQLSRFYMWANELIFLGYEVPKELNSLPEILDKSNEVDYSDTILRFTQYTIDNSTNKTYKLIPWEEFKEMFCK